MLHASTIRLLRIPFSFFLSPLYFFTLALVPQVDWFNAIIIFIILHFFIYPASNGYNSYMDRDTGSIGGIEKPPPPTRELYLTTIVMDLVAVLLGLLISPLFSLFSILYIGASKAYSYRGIRLKRFPFIGYLTVIVFQGAFTFWLVYYGSNTQQLVGIPWQGLATAALLIGGFYPLTQIYQHRQDLDDGVVTISYKLGYKGSFIFCGILYIMAWLCMAHLFITNNQPAKLVVVTAFFVPVIWYFLHWFSQVREDTTAANFSNTMTMNWLASACTNAAFFTLLTWRYFE